jgi:hypothetical protein
MKRSNACVPRPFPAMTLITPPQRQPAVAIPALRLASGLRQFVKALARVSFEAVVKRTV